MLVDLYRQGRLRPRRVRHRDHRARRRRGSLRPDARAARCCARWWSSEHDSTDGVRVDHAVTSGTFCLDGETWDVDNNVWVRRRRRRVRRHRRRRTTLDAIAALVGDRTVRGRASAPTPTTTTPRGARAAPSASARRSCCTRPTSRCGDLTHADRRRTPTWPTATCSRSPASRCTCCTPPATPRARSACYAPDLGTVFTGDTLFQGGPGATGPLVQRPADHRGSIRARLLTLPDDTVVRTGHGDEHHDRRRRPRRSAAEPSGRQRPSPALPGARDLGISPPRPRPARHTDRAGPPWGTGPGGRGRPSCVPARSRDDHVRAGALRPRGPVHAHRSLRRGRCRRARHAGPAAAPPPPGARRRHRRRGPRGSGRWPAPQRSSASGAWCWAAPTGSCSTCPRTRSPTRT